MKIYKLKKIPLTFTEKIIILVIFIVLLFIMLYFYNLNRRNYNNNQNLSENIIYAYESNKVTIAFSFDDGPNGNKTIEIVDTLEKYNMSATFFMVGSKLSKNKDVVKYVRDSNSEIGYHSFNHEYFTKQKKDDILKEYNEANEILYDITNERFTLVRPPYGSYNKDVLNTIDLPFVTWNVDTNDWKYKDVDYIVNHVLNNYSDGSIILFHDSYKTTVEAIKKLIPILNDANVQVVSVSNLAKIRGVNLKNGLVYKKIRSN